MKVEEINQGLNGLVVIAEDDNDMMDLRNALEAMDEHVPEGSDERFFVDNVLEEFPGWFNDE